MRYDEYTRTHEKKKKKLCDETEVIFHSGRDQYYHVWCKRDVALNQLNFALECLNCFMNADYTYIIFSVRICAAVAAARDRLTGKIHTILLSI